MGASLVIDIIALFLGKSLLRFLCLIRSSRWSQAVATVRQVNVLDPDWGCPAVKVFFRVTSTNGLVEGASEIPFLFRRSAREYATTFFPGKPVVVRVGGRNAQRALFFSIDQEPRSSTITEPGRQNGDKRK